MNLIMAKRIGISLLIGLILGVIISETAFYFWHDTSRPPEVIQLVIPAGTAQRVANGQQPPSIPSSMSFVVGDVLEVKNEDSVNHQLGPLWIPAGTTASLHLNTIESYAYTCSFQPKKIFGLDVQEPLTLGTRLLGIFFAGVPLGMLIAIYSSMSGPKKKTAELLP